MPEVKKLIDGTDSGGGGGGGNSNNVLSNVSAWLVVNSMRSETLQQNLLLEQSMKNVWRKRAYECLKDDYVESIYGSNPNHLNNADVLMLSKHQTAFLFFLPWTSPNILFSTDKLALFSMLSSQLLL